MKISVIIPVYNGEAFLEETLSSVLSQSFADFEVILVDDGSTDKSAEIIKSFKDERIKYFKQKNSGSPAGPRNFGIKKAKGEWIAFIDQDDIWYQEKLEEELKFIGGSVGIIFSTTDIIDGEGKKVGSRPVSEGRLEKEGLFEMLTQECFITNCSTLVKKEVFEKVGYLNEELKGNDDYDLWLRAAEKFDFYGIEKSLCAWRKSSEQMSSEMSKIFLGNEQILLGVKTTGERQKGLISEALKRNSLRLFIAYVKEGSFDKAKNILQEKEMVGGMSIGVIVNLFKISPSLTRGLLLAKTRIRGQK